ncbi:hypothetical protein [Hymenobacter cellulosilyticus]|uniref:VCBS repeat-containing protein n=1 Tax=Hymenobacter cellulosilyticus TaxID=2932248 RepID=A0A8T9Q8V1_9BACT|nr:hypothetical protein [Hymenobacter cellulosilyticus]UOQ71959.1 hypothetical protein MUN79_25750 [Hymenobacter cellulosilyticus]
MLAFLVATNLFASAAAALPGWAQTRWQQSGLEKTYARTSYLQPGFLQADFNGDGKQDVAILVTRKQTQSRGILILHQGLPQHHLLGGGKGPELLQGSFTGFFSWSLYTKPSTFEILLDKTDTLAERTVKLRYPTIEMGNEEGPIGMIYWNGSKYIWLYQTC